MSQAFPHLKLTFKTVKPSHEAVVIVGAGPVGLSLAIDLAMQGVKVTLLDDDDTLSTGSRAICFAKRTLEYFHRLGVAKQMLEKGVVWNKGRLFHQDREIYSFDLQPEQEAKFPAFINLQQYYVEGFLLEKALSMPNIDIRWKNSVVNVTQDELVTLTVATADGEYHITADYCVACDGARSPIRKSLGLESKGVTFKDRFLIADIKMKAAFPTERWFWFDPPFHPNQSVLLHKQPDDIWRIDFQLGWEADPILEKTPEKVLPRVKALLGDKTQFELEWVSIYTFSCLRMDKFLHNRVIFAGDSAHGVSPFGARGANSGIQDAENLAWKLARVVKGESPPSLLESYNQERVMAADENILNSTRSTDFLTPKTHASRVFRDACLHLAKDHAFARKLVNSGRLSEASHYNEITLAHDKPFEGGYLYDHLGGQFKTLYFGDNPPNISIETVTIPAKYADIWQKYKATDGMMLLIRPDQYICGSFHKYDEETFMKALKNAQN